MSLQQKEGPFYQNEETNCAPGPDYCKNIKNNYALTNFGANFDQSYDGKGTCCNSQVLKPMKALGSSEISHERCSLDYQKPTAKITVSKKNAHVDAVDDVEVNAAREHVTFSITGMTCTGCAKKVMGVLDHIVGVSNAKINFVAAIGDLDINKARISASAALQQLERETGFKCSRIAGYHQSLDLVMTRTAVQALSDNPPKGVESIERAGRVYRVVFDPLLIGARKVLSASGGILAPPSNDGAVTKGRRRLITKLWSFIAAAIFTVPVVVLAWSEAPVTFMAKSIVSLVLGTLVQVIAIPEFYIPALKALVFSRSIEMDMLVVISITAAYGYSVVAFSLEHAGINLQQGDFFETSTLLITLVLLGRLVSAYATVRAVQAVSLRSLQAETAYLESPADEVMKLDARLLEFNDVIRILPHSKIVSDGEVVNGVSAVDESMLTGEGHPIFKTVGDNVIAGTLNGPGPLSIRLTRLPGQNSITDIADLVQNALSTKPRIQDLADVVAGYFIPVVVTISVVVFAVWVVVALQIRDQNAGGAIGAAITYTIAVLAISCPCALGLAVPLVLVIAGGVAARAGVIIKHADATERGYRVTDVVFDKTGTLTNGQLQVVRQELHKSSFSSSEALALAFTLVKDNEHPISQAVANALKLQNAQMVELKAVESIPGAGIQAVWQGFSVKAGNAYWLRTDTNPTIVSLQADGLTLLCVTVKDELIISFGLKAELRSEAQSVINVLQARSIVCHVVSGDQPVVVSNIAASLNIPTSNIASRQSPANKQAYVQNLISMGKTTLFVGDGTNDAVAIAQANVGVQIGSASDITKATADVVLLGGLDGIITLLDVSKQSYYRIRFNFIWSFLYNLFAILLASGAFVKVRITPSFAGLGEIVSVLPVVLTALTLLRVKVGQR
ncbi:hypothetical protein H2198_010602 [Neophaeococcomyces mojaviensis]|uniref:Uncharacterized protein n=1 Tax=Neophaeococcomyces mojaviensis TaxID=3383035 RepID=A0ACC2ZR39_9EURO|nr:hypothetical protein H2198_010602 [Knufia sp. JES_112]